MFKIIRSYFNELNYVSKSTGNRLVSTGKVSRRFFMPFIRFCIVFTLVLLSACGTQAQTFTASVNRTTVGVDEQFQISFTFSGTDINGVKSFNPPGFNGFMVLSGPNESTSMQIINSSVSASRTYSYYLQPKSTGKYTIGSASLNYNGKTFNTQPITMDVVKGSPKPPAAKSGSNNSTVASTDIGDNLFILATANRNKVYLGEPVTVTYKLYTRLGIASQMQVSKLPSYEGFWAEEINTSNTINFTTEMYKGKQYRVGVLKKVELFPSQLGELSVTPMQLQVPVQIRQNRKRSGDIFDDFFNDPFFNPVQTVNYTAKSNTIKIHAVALPSKNVPKNFNGAVGEYTLSSKISKTNVKTNEPVSLKINISGSGNISLINTPEINLPPGFDKYEPKTSDQINRNGSISGTKTFDYLIVPRNPGKKEIPPVQFSFFNPEKGNYVTLSTPGYELNVAQGSGGGGESIAGYTKEEIKLLGQDIHYIKTSTGDLRRQGSDELFGTGFWTATILPLVLLSGLVTWKRKQDKLAGNIQLLRYQRAEKVAKARFKTAKTLMETNNQTGFYAEISQALFGYLEDKLHIPKGEISLVRVMDELQQKNIDGNIISSLKDCTEKCDYARFAPSQDGKAEMNGMYNELTKLIIELEKSLSVKRYA